MKDNDCSSFAILADEHTHDFFIPKATKEEVRNGINEDHVVVPASLGSAAAYDANAFATAEQGRKAEEAFSHEIAGALAQKDKIEISDIDTSGEPRADTVLTGSGWKIFPASFGDMQSFIYDPRGLQSDVFSMSNMTESENALILTTGERNKIKGIDKLNNDIIGIKADVALAQEKANAALPKRQAGLLAEKDQIELTDIKTKGSPSANMVLSGDGWKAMPETGIGDMLSSVYDPSSIGQDVFDMANMKESDNNLILKVSERRQINKIDIIEGSVRDVEEDIRKIKEDVDEVKQCCQTAENKNDEQDEEINKLKKADEDINNKISDVETNVTNLDKKLDEKAEEINTKIDTETRRLDKKVDDESVKLDKKVEQESQKLDTKISEETRKLGEKVDAESNKLDQKIDAETKKLSDKVNAESEKLDQKISKETDKLTKKIDEESKKLGQKVDEESQKLNQKVNDETTKLDQKFTAESTKIDNKITTVSQEIEQKLNTKSTEIENKITAKETELQGKIESKGTEIENRLNEKIKTIESKDNSQDIEIENIKATANKADKCCVDITAKVKDLQQKNVETDKCCKDLTAKVQGLEAKHNEYDNKISEIEDKNNTQEATLREHSGHVETIKNDITGVKNKNTEQDEQLKQLKTSIENVKATSDNTKECCDELKKKSGELDNHIESYRRKYDADQKQFKSIQRRIVGIMDTTSSVRDTAQKLDTDIRDVRSNIDSAKFEINELKETIGRIDPNVIAYSQEKFQQLEQLEEQLREAQENIDQAQQTAQEALAYTRTVPRAARALYAPYLVPDKKKKNELIIYMDTTIFEGSRSDTIRENTRIVTRNLKPGKDYEVYYDFAYGYKPNYHQKYNFVVSEVGIFPVGRNKRDLHVIGGFHTLCANTGTIVGGHPLNNMKAGDILPKSVWCHNHRPFSKPYGMVHDNAMDIWVDIYLQSGTRGSTKSVFGGRIQCRSYNDHCIDLQYVGKRLLTYEEFISASRGTPSANRTATAYIKDNAGGGSVPSGARCVSYIGVEECVDFYWQWLSGSGFAYYSAFSSEPIGPMIGGSHAEVGEHNNLTLKYQHPLNVKTTNISARGRSHPMTFQ